MEITTQSAASTEEFGKQFANQLKGGETLALVGGLGSGKTTFVQGLALGLGVKAKIISPTFVLMRQYQITNHQSLITNLYHIDLYRLEGDYKKELQTLGISELWEDSNNILIIEWADKAKEFLPPGTIWITFTGSGDEARKIKVSKV